MHLVVDPDRAAFLRDVVAGLSQQHRSIPCKYFYDARGSELFEEITRLAEYYPTRAELAILEAHAGEIAAAIGPEAVLVELGSGSSTKTRLLLDELEDAAAYVPIDISAEHLLATVDDLKRVYPGLTIIPIAADYTGDVALPELPPHRRRVSYFPGSTIGNFDPAEAETFLRRLVKMAAPDGGMVIGVDLRKDPAVLERAYDDAEGVTAAFNLNLLRRISRDLDGRIDLEAFEHRAVWNEAASRVEMYLVSLKDQEITVAGHRFALAAGEAIHTESSYKYSIEDFSRLASRAGFAPARTWLDPGSLFSVHYLEIA